MISDSVKDLIDKMLIKEPKDRITSRGIKVEDLYLEVLLIIGMETY